MSINIIGISAFYHNSACCLIQDGILKVAVEEERFTRKKNDSRLPCNSFEFCLENSDLSITDIDCIAYYEDPLKKIERQKWSGYDINKLHHEMDPNRPINEIRKLLGYEGPIEIMNHHLSHAASSYYFSGFDEAAILTVDGVGEWATTTYGYGSNNKIDIFEEVIFPDSIGLFYATITSYLGFKVNSGEYKVMGLAPYGRPIYVNKIKKLIILKDKGQFELKMEYFDFIKGDCMFSNKLIELLGQEPRIPESEITQFHKDVARSLQYVLEEIILLKVRYLFDRTKSKNLCMAGGVALNCVANGRILKEGPFKKIFIQPGATDSGCAIGAAALAYTKLTNKKVEELKNVYLGPKYTSDKINRLLDATSLKYENYQGKEEELIAQSAELIAKGKVIGWFQGKMEFGARALGARSILADPRNNNMRDIINSMVKKREGFRPFAPAVLESKYKDHFDLQYPSPYMLFTCNVTSKLDLPAITHINGSARVQTVNESDNPLFAKLISKFDELTGCPIILNTSFNVRGEPIVMSPIDALKCFINTKIDVLVISDFIIKREENSLTELKLAIKLFEKAAEITKVNNDSVYTFI